MKFFIVHAHPDPASFNSALKNMAVATLTDEGHEVAVSDLYQMQFKATMDTADFSLTRKNLMRLQFDVEQEHQHLVGAYPADVAMEQARVEWCDVMIFHFPIWWFSMPSILKGWVERVLARGFAYGPRRKHATGHFAGRRAMVTCTTGAFADVYAPDGIEGDIGHLLWPINNGIFHYMGFTPLPSFVAYAPRLITDSERAKYLGAYAQRLRSLEGVAPLFMHPADDYGPNQRLTVEARSGFQWNPGAGQSREQAARHHTSSDPSGPDRPDEP
ncbi:NAD(P)H-dependent oxidoreductase [Streptomyces cyaneofuscatus]|uniref:NAD(P)H-dependent oxidoreductase n=1 Tax=Streptomyces cyaneofuscatus TaxID=66883 RepID=UPI003656EA74